MKKYKYEKPIRRATPKELEWVNQRLVDFCGCKVIFSIEKIYSNRVLLHVKNETDLFSIQLKFNGRFLKPMKSLHLEKTEI